MLTWTLISVPSACLAALYEEGPLGVSGIAASVARRSSHAIQLEEKHIRGAIKELVATGLAESKPGKLATMVQLTTRGKERLRYERKCIAGLYELPLQIHKTREVKIKRVKDKVETRTAEDIASDDCGMDEGTPQSDEA